MTTTHGTDMDQHRTLPRLDRQSVLVLAMALAMAALAVPLGLPFTDEPAVGHTLLLPWWLLAICFAATEACVLHIQTGREAQTVSISELAVVVGLFYATPVDLLLGHLIGSAAILLLHRRSSALKTIWNLSALSLQIAVAVSLFHLVSGGSDATHWLAWLAAYVGCLGANRVSVLAVVLVMALYDGGLRPLDVLREVVSGDPASPVVITLGLVAVTSLAAAPGAVVLLLVMGAGLLLGYRAYASLSDRHLGLERLYRFTQAISSSPEVDEIVGSVLTEARDLLHAERAEALFVATAGGAVARVRLGARGRLTRMEDPPGPTDAWLIARVVDGGQPLLLSRGARDLQTRAWLDAHGSRDAIAVPLRGGAGVLGALVVTDRLGEVRTFESSDVLLVETVANHASVALQNGELISQLRHDAMHDALTGLPNRALLQRRLASLLDDVADARTSGAAVMILDLDGFKEVNDTLGHQQGDLLLVEVGERLRSAVGASGLVARLGGDEFAVLLERADEDRAVRIGRRVLRSLELPIVLDDLDVEVAGSMGIALAPLHADDPASLLKRADVAMYDAKRCRRGLTVYDPDMDPHDVSRLSLVAELRAALNSTGVELHVQPQADAVDGAVRSVEALVRWNHPDRGTIPPDKFIPMAERTGLIGPLTTRMLDLSLAAVAEWRRTGRELSIAVNLSSRSLLDVDLVAEVARLLRRHDVPPARLTLEVTESSVMADPARAIGLLHELRALGVRLSVDDFGTGYSSLSYLQRLPVDEVKIDRSFVTGLHDRPGDSAIVRAIVDLGRGLGLDVVAEGVEDQRTWDVLAQLGCHMVQGWHLARPMAASALLPWLHEREGRRGRPAPLRSA